MYDYGPVTDMSLELVGTIKEANNGLTYADLDANTKTALQLFCHAVYQLKDEAVMSPGGVLHAGDIMLLAIEGSYLIMMPDMMEVMHILDSDRSPTAFDIEFISVNQLMKCDPFLDYAEWHASRYGRAV